MVSTVHVRMSGGRPNTVTAINERHCGQAYDNLIDKNGRESSIAVVNLERINVLIQPLKGGVVTLD